MLDFITFNGVLGFGLSIFAVILLFSTAFIVREQDAVVIERMGRFNRVARPGLRFKIPLMERKAGDESLRIETQDLTVESKTKDNVFVHIKIAIQDQVDPERVKEAFYKLDDVLAQEEAYAKDVVRSEVPKLTLDEVFERKDDIGKELQRELQSKMGEYGYRIISALVVDVEPDETVKAAMNAINAAQRHQVATQSTAEANRILLVKQAEGEAEAKKLQGQGIADQRKAIIAGLRESVADFSAATGTSPADVMTLVMMTQYFDTIKSLGDSGRTNTILLPHSPGGLSDLAGQIRSAVIVGNVATNGDHA